MFTWNLRGGPSGWIRALATSATVMPRRRTAGRLLSRRLFTPAMRLASRSASAHTHMLSVGGVRGQAQGGTGGPHCPLTLPAVPELHLPQVRQADEDGLADVALLGQRRMTDGTAAAPRLQELLQHLAGGTAQSDSPTYLPSTGPLSSPLPVAYCQPDRGSSQHSLFQAGAFSLPFPAEGGPRTPRMEGQTALTCMRSGRRWLSMARYPSRLCSMGVCDRSQASRHCLPGRHQLPT